jgi:hypothetical protein
VPLKRNNPSQPNSAQNWVLRAKARTGHSGQVFSPAMGSGAAFEIARILSALPSIEHEDRSVLGGRLEFLSANVRLADPAELAQATSYVESKLVDRLPSNIEENYARETVLLAKMPPTRQVPLQVLRAGDMAIVGYPTETYNATGLAVRAASPFRVTLNIGLANDLLGYLPPADQFPLGGYTTWRVARRTGSYAHAGNITRWA